MIWPFRALEKFICLPMPSKRPSFHERAGRSVVGLGLTIGVLRYWNSPWPKKPFKTLLTEAPAKESLCCTMALAPYTSVVVFVATPARRGG